VLHQRIDVRLLQKLTVGAAAGDPVPDPDFGVVVSGVTVNAIRVTVRDVTDPAHPKTESDVIIGRADSRVDRFGAASCKVSNPQVSGSGYVIGLDADESAVDPLRQLNRVRIGEVLLPSTGGEENAELLHVGPIFDPKHHLLLESNAAFSNTAGTVDPAAGSAESDTVSSIEELRALDVGNGPQLSVDLARAECGAKVGSGAPQSQAKTTLVGLKIGHKDVCEALDAEGKCTPAPNTEVDLGVPGLKIVLNEQVPDPASAGTGITVNAIHVRVLGAGNSLGLPLGANLVVSNAHCDAEPAAGAAPAPSTPPAGAKPPLSLPLGLSEILKLGKGSPGLPSTPNSGGLLSTLTSLLRLSF
jgi:hypothetical protein